MAVDKFDVIWASGGAAEQPTIQRQSTGFTSGPADPSEVNWAIQTLQQNHNDLTDLVNSYSIVDDLNLYVPADYPTIQAAFDYLADKRIAPPAIVRIFLAGEQFVISGELSLDHPNGNRIHMIGEATLGSWPTEANIPADKATAENVLRSLFPTVVRCIGTRAMSLLNNAIGRIENVLFLGDGSANPGLRLGLRGGQFGRGAAYVQTVWFHGFGSSGVYAELGSQLTGDRLGVSFNDEGIRIARSVAFITNVRALRNTKEGVNCSQLASATLHDIISAYNGSNGITAFAGSVVGSERAKFIGNVGYHAYTAVSASVNYFQPNVAGAAGAGTAFYATLNGYQQIQQPTGTPSYSPGAGASGNNGAFTTVL